MTGGAGPSGLPPVWGALAVVLVVVATVGVGTYGLRLSRTTSDFLVASRTVSPAWNASAIGGEYLSAASFLGVAGLVMAYGADMLWYPVGYTAGYLVLLLFVAAPLRRSGAYTLPDFAEARLDSRGVRLLSSAVVVGVGWLYLLPQLQGAGLTLRAVTGAPPAAGAVLVAAVVTATVASGGMRSITFVQGFQYWLKVTAIAVPAAVLLLAWRADGAPTLTGPQEPEFRRATAVAVEEPARVVLVEPVAARGEGGPRVLAPGPHDLSEGTVLEFPAGAPVPHVEGLAPATGDAWARPLSGAGGRDHPLYATWSLGLALFLGTMGLPHVLVRFYTNPDGRAARRTTVIVLGLLGLFYLSPAVYGALGRLYVPELLLTGDTDAVVLALPAAVVPGTGGLLLGGLVTAGAFAAFLSTSTGLVATVAGVLGQDLLPEVRALAGRRRTAPEADARSPRRPRGSLRSLRAATVVAGLVPLALSVPAAALPVSQVVGLAFAVAASTFCPLLVLGIWWRGLTAAGAAAGLAVGGLVSGTAVAVGLSGTLPAGWPAALAAAPAAWSVPLAFAATVLVSRATRARVPADVAHTMALLHTPEPR